MSQPDHPDEPTGLDSLLGADTRADRSLAESIVDTVRDPLLVLNGNLRVVAAGREFYRAFDVTPAETLGRRVYELGGGQWDLPPLRTLLEEILPRETVFRDFEVEHAFDRIGRRVLLLNARRLLVPSGGRALILLVIEDVTARRDAEDARREAEVRFTEMVRNVRDHSIFLTDPDGVITSWNVAAERIIGYTEAEAVGRHFALIFTPEDVAAGVPELELRQAAAAGRAEDERWHLCKGDERFWALGVVTPLHDPAGRLTGFSKILRDLTGRKRAEERLRVSEARLRLALDAARMGIWTWDPAADIHVRDANLNRLLGLDPVETVRPLADFLARMHPADRAGVAAGFDAAVRDGCPLSVEFRVVWPDGTVRWLRDQGDKGGMRGGGLTGAVVDVTDRLAVEERLRLVLASATDYAILTLDPDRVVTSWSPGAEVTFGYPAAEIVGRPFGVLFTPEDRAAGADAAEAETARRDGRSADERWHLRRDGSRFYASGVLTLLGDPERGFVKVLRDLTDRKRIEDELRAARDELERRVAERTAELRAALEALEVEMARRAALAQRLATVQEDERRRIARDLHDTVGQTLTGLSLAVAGVASGPLPAPVAERLEQVRRLADELGRELHGVAMLLRPTALDDIGLEPAVRTLAADWSRRAGMTVEVTATTTAGRFPPEVETALYRVVQEALSNVAKHAGASRVSVVLGRRDAEAVVVVEDDGTGFDPEAVRTPTPGRRGGLGLLGMRERVGLLGGTVEVESQPGGGTTVIARIPLENPS